MVWQRESEEQIRQGPCPQEAAGQVGGDDCAVTARDTREARTKPLDYQGRGNSSWMELGWGRQELGSDLLNRGQ